MKGKGKRRHALHISAFSSHLEYKKSLPLLSEVSYHQFATIFLQDVFRVVCSSFDHVENDENILELK